MEQDRRARLLLAAGLTPDADLSPRAQAALQTLLGAPDGYVEAVLAMWALVDEARPAPTYRPSTGTPGGFDYPNPRPKARKPPSGL